MNITCEKCSITFQLDDKLIKPKGSMVRCSKCKHIFKVFPPSHIDTLPPMPPVKEGFTVAQRPQKEEQPFGEHTLTLVDFSEEAFVGFDPNQEHYVELGSIGEGGMGEVRLARDSYLLRKVAIKALKPEITSPAAIRYFLREAQITAQLDHPNIVPLYTVKPPEKGEKNVSFVMKLIKGKTLSDIITKARAAYQENPKAELDSEINLNARLGYFLKACEGIAYAHRKQVVHRDLKPSNIMIGDFGEVYVMDWGIARMLKDAPETLMNIQEVVSSKHATLMTEQTQAGAIVGTPSYMSPEQAKGLPNVGPASDIFSLGVILYELVTLRPARPGDTAQKMKWAEGGYINQITHFIPDQKIPPELQAIINKATATEPEDRYPSVAKLAEDIRCFLRGDEVSELPDSRTKKIWRWMNRHRELSIIFLLTLFLCLSAGIIISQFQKQRAMLRAQQREARLTRLLTDVSTQAHLIDSRFLHLEDLMIGLANSAMYLIQDAPPNNEKFYWISEFNNPEKDPPDHEYSPLYKRPVSIDYPVVKLAPGVKEQDVIPLMQKLAPLRHHFKKMLLDSRGSFAAVSDEEARRLMTIHGLLISWAYIGLDAGVMYSYPGKGTYPDDYDPRVRPWYKLGANKQTVNWGNPYIDLQGLGMVLPCATSLYDRKGNFYGVIGMDVTYNNIIQENLQRPGAVGVIESFLLDDKGRIVVGSSHLTMKVEEKAKDPSLKLNPFPVQQVVDSIQKKESGIVETIKEKQSRIVVFQQMKSLGWYYVEEVDTASILKTE